MRFFQYTARDNQNKNVGGTMQAATEDEARQSLAKFGLQVLTVQELSSPQRPAEAQAPRNLGGDGTAKAGTHNSNAPIIQPPAPRQINPSTSIPPRPAPPRPVPPTAAPQQASPYNYNQPPSIAPAPTAAPAPAIIRTVNGTDKQRFFLFSQLASALRAGINPSQAFHEVAQRSAGQFRPSLDEAAAATGEGKSISQVFERYPDLYPEHVVGMIRAGEAAGFVPDALDEVARQAESAHAFGRWFFWVWFLMINFLISIPGMWITTRAMLGTIDALNKTGGEGGSTAGLRDFSHALWQAFLWPWGPITAACYAAIWVFRRYYVSSFAKDIRHRMGLKFPVYGARARHENLARFSWTMSRVGRAGIAPARAWQLAADSVPNLEFRRQLMDVGAQMRESTRMSDIIHRSPVFPDEYAPLVATAEYTGDLPGAMEHLANVSAGEFMAAQNYAKARSGCWGLLGCFVTSGIMMGIFYWAWYHEVPQKVLGDDNPLGP